MKSKSFELFDKIRYEDINQYDKFILLREYSENFNLELLKTLARDLDFYLFVEVEEERAKYSNEDIKQAINDREEKGIELPYYHSKLSNQKGNAKYLNTEELLFPFEFFTVRQFSYLIKRKIEEVIGNQDANSFKKIENEHTLDLSNAKDINKVRYLIELGLVDFLKDKVFPHSNNAIASALTGVTGIKRETMQPYINAYLTEARKNNPTNNNKEMSKIKQVLTELGYIKPNSDELGET